MNVVDEKITTEEIVQFPMDVSNSFGDTDGGNGINGYTDSPLISQNAIIIGRVGEYCGSVYLTKGPVWITDNALYSKKISSNCDIHFLFWYLKWFDLTKISYQTSQPLITQKIISFQKIFLPSLPEQTAIATVLSEIDAEISALETRRAKTLSLKQGMMQELLTGRIRLV